MARPRADALSRAPASQAEPQARHRAGGSAGAYAWRSLLGLLALAAFSLTIKLDPCDSALAQSQEPFRHGKHVERRWLGVEVPRDCRGCHQELVDEPASADPALTLCGRCHNPGPVSRENWFELDPVQGSYEERYQRVFDHREHDWLATGSQDPLQGCSDCHISRMHPGLEERPSNLDRSGLKTPDMMLVPDGTGWCVGCHDTDRKPRYAMAKVEPFSRAMDERLAPLDKARFLHRDHMTDLSDPSTCKDCHAQVANAEAQDLITNSATLRARDNCGECHIGWSLTAPDRNEVSALSGERAGEVVSISAGTFSHRIHLTHSAREKSTQKLDGDLSISTHECLACHVASETETRDRSQKSPEWALRRGSRGYADCSTACHYHLTSTDRLPPVPEHTGPTGWSGCAGCHDFAAGPQTLAAVRAQRPQVSVKWRRLSYFVGETHRHPLIVGHADADLSEPSELKALCSECHRARLETLPSRIRKRRFDHRTHLPENPTDKNCVDCHRSIPQADSTLAIAIGDRIYSDETCTRCHSGGVRFIETEPAATEVTEFPHALHIGQEFEGAPMTCDSCHILDPSSGDYGYTEGSQNCLACHNHEEHTEYTYPEHPPAYFKSCALCHVEKLPAADFKRPEKSATLWRLLSGQQHHPTPAETWPERRASEALCTSCHLIPEKYEWIQPTREPFAKRLYTQSGTGTPFHLPPAGNGVEKVEDCWDCHWSEIADSEINRGKAPDRIRAEDGRFTIYPRDGR